MSVTHKLTLKMTETSQNAKESDLLYPLPVVSFNLLKKISITDRIRDTDNLRTINLPGTIYGTPIQYPRYRDWETDRKSTRLNSSHSAKSRMPSSA